MRYHETLVARFASKLVLDFLPATAASLIGGVLFAHYGLGRVPEAVARAEPASTEMMQLLRDEHGLIVSFMTAQLEREKTELAADSMSRRGNGEAAPTSAIARISPAAVSAKSGVSRARVAAAPPSLAVAQSTASAPLVIAAVQQPESAVSTSQGPQLLIARTAGLKDHVVSVTHRVVSTLGGIPGWIGDHLGGTNARPRPAAEAVTTS